MGHWALGMGHGSWERGMGHGKEAALRLRYFDCAQYKSVTGVGCRVQHFGYAQRPGNEECLEFVHNLSFSLSPCSLVTERSRSMLPCLFSLSPMTKSYYIPMISYPASTYRTCPVMPLAKSLAKKAAVLPTSC